MKIFDPVGFSSKLTGSFSGSFTGDGSSLTGTISSSIATTASYIKLSNVDGSASLASRIFTNSSSIGSLNAASGSYANSASFASDISTNSASIASLETVSGSYANSASFASDISTNSASISSLETVSGSYANSASFASSISANSSSIGSLNAVSSSYLLNTTDTLTGDLTVTGNIIATTLNVQDVTASVVYSSGSNIFGSSSIDTQQFTGSILTSGSIEVNGDKFTVSGATGDATFGGNVSLIASSAINLRVTDGTQNLYVGSSGNTRFGLGAGASIIQGTGASFGVGTQDGNSLILGTNNTAALTIDTSQNATFAGSITIPQYIYHTGDTDTYIAFAADRQTYLAGGDEFIDFREATESYITIGNSNDTDTRMQGGAGYVFIQGSNGYIGINDATPSYPFEVNANTYIGGTLETSGNATFGGNVGIGITPSTSFSGIEVLQLGGGMTLYGGSGDRATMASNLIVNTGTAFEYVIDGLAGRFSIEDGYMIWGTAPTGTAGSVATVTTRMTLMNDGRLGIGTDSPDNILHVRAGDTGYASQVGADTMLFLETTNVSNALQFTSANTGQQYIMFGDDDPNAGWVSYDHSDNNLNFRVNGSEKLRIVAAGAVGIDNSSPDSFSGGGSTTASLVIGKGTSSVSPQLTLWQGNSAQATINFASANTGTGQYEGRIRYTRDTGIMDFRTNGIADVLVLNASGNATFAGNVTTGPTISLTSDNDTGYTNSRVILNATESTSRGAGIFCFNSADDIEWYSGLGYATNDFIISYKSTTSHTDETADQSLAKFKITTSGSATFNGTGGTTNVTVYDGSGNSEVGLKLQGDAATWTLQNWGSGGDKLRVLNNAGSSMQVWEDDGSVIFGGTDINGSYGASNTILAVQGSTSGGEGIIQITGKGNNATDNVGKIDFHSYSEADPMCSIRSIRGSADDQGELQLLTNSGGTIQERLTISKDGLVFINKDGFADGGLITGFRTAISVGQSAVAIGKVATYGGLAMVWMNYAGNIGYDLVSYSLSQVTVLSSQAISGGTSSRTYTAVSGVLKLTMGGSDTYSVYATEIRTANT